MVPKPEFGNKQIIASLSFSFYLFSDKKTCIPQPWVEYFHPFGHKRPVGNIVGGCKSGNYIDEKRNYKQSRTSAAGSKHFSRFSCHDKEFSHGNIHGRPVFSPGSSGLPLACKAASWQRESGIRHYGNWHHSPYSRASQHSHRHCGHSGHQRGTVSNTLDTFIYQRTFCCFRLPKETAIL